MEWIGMALAAFMAGGVDAMVGGGGLILLPSLLAMWPTSPTATLLGTNKAIAVWGTSAAATRYLRRVDLPWSTLLPAGLLAAIGACAGAWAVTVLPSDRVRQALPLVLAAVWLYTWRRKDLGQQHRPRFQGRRQGLAAAVLGLSIGAYDGFLGPGTGSFFMFAGVRWLGFDFLHASALAKWLNAASNLAAVALFTWAGHVWWAVALLMALCHVAGSLLGAHLALRHGTRLVRRVFLVVVLGLLLKTAWDVWLV